MSDFRIQLPASEMVPVDFELARKYLAPMPGRTVVEMQPVDKETASGLVLSGSGRAERRLRPDVGTVLAAGAGVPLVAGDVVIVDYEHGKYIENAVFGEYRAAEQVRMYGAAAEAGGEPLFVPWHESIWGLYMSEKELPVQPLHDWVLIEREDVQESVSGIILPDDAKFRSSIGRVLAAGPLAMDVAVGSRVIYLANTVRKLAGIGRITWLADKNLVMMRERAILTAIPDDAAVKLAA